MLGHHGRLLESSRLRSRPASDRWSIFQSPYFSSQYISRLLSTKGLATLQKPSRCTKAPRFLSQHLLSNGHAPKYPLTSPSSLLLTLYLSFAPPLTLKIISCLRSYQSSSLSACRIKTARFAPPIISSLLPPYQRPFSSQSNLFIQHFKPLSKPITNISCAWSSISCPGNSSVALWATRRRGAREPARIWLINV